MEPLIERILSAIARATALINSLMLFGRKKQAQQHSDIMISDIVNSAIMLVKLMVPKNIEFIYKTDLTTEKIHGNKFEVEQIILNMVNNAIHAIGDKFGCIEIKILKDEQQRECGFQI